VSDSMNTERAVVLAKVFFFLCACTREVAQTAPALFVDLARKAKDLALTELNLPKSAIIPLRHAVLKLQYFPEDLTPLHADLFQVLLRPLLRLESFVLDIKPLASKPSSSEKNRSNH